MKLFSSPEPFLLEVYPIASILCVYSLDLLLEAKIINKMGRFIWLDKYILLNHKKYVGRRDSNIYHL